MTALVDPISTDTWVATATLTLFAFVLWLSIDDHSHISYICGSSIIFIVDVITQQGFEHLKEVRRLSLRILELTALIFGLLIFAYYSAILLTFLLSPSPKTIRTLRQLIDSDLNVGAENVTTYTDSFTKFNLSFANEVYAKKIKSQSNFLPLSEGITKMRQGSYAFQSEDQVMFRLMIENFTNYELCAAQVIDVFPYRTPFHIPYQKGKPYGEFLARGHILFMERGITNRADKLWSYMQPSCVASEYAPVAMEELLFAYLVIIVGVFLTTLVFLCERINSFKHFEHSNF